MVNFYSSLGALRNWPWPQIVVAAFLVFLIWGSMVAGVRNALLAVRSAVTWLNYPAPPLTGHALGNGKPELAASLLPEVRYLVDARAEHVRGLDAKATVQVAVLGGGLVILSSLGAAEPALTKSGTAWLLLPAVVLMLLGAIAALLSLMRGQRRTSVVPFVDESAAADSLLARYWECSYDLAVVAERKSRLLQVATACFIAGVAFLSINTLWAQAHAAPRPGDCRSANCPEAPVGREINPVNPLEPPR